MYIWICKCVDIQISTYLMHVIYKIYVEYVICVTYNYA